MIECSCFAGEAERDASGVLDFEFRRGFAKANKMVVRPPKFTRWQIPPATQAKKLIMFYGQILFDFDQNCYKEVQKLSDQPQRGAARKLETIFFSKHIVKYILLIEWAER